MNLSLVLNTAAAPGAAPATANMMVSPEMAAFQDFLSLVGLAPLAAEGPEAAQPDMAAEGMDPDLAALTGNILPPALPVLPVLPLASDAVPPPAASGSPALPAPTPQHMLVQAQVAGLPLPPVTAQQLAADARGAVTPATSPAPPVMPVQPLAVSITAIPAEPAPSAAQDAVRVAASQPVLAQLVQAQQVAVRGEQGLPGAKGPARKDDAVPGQSIAAGPVAAPVAAEAARPVLRSGAAAGADSQPSAAAPLPVAAPVAPVAAMPSAQTGGTAAAAAGADSAPAPHDFAAVVDRLEEARELARPGRADLHMTHREFGPVSVQFELAGQALKVAMSSPDQAFAPAVQAALAERPLAVADMARSDNAQPRTDSVTASTPAFHAGAGADGQRGDGQPRSAQQRPVADQPQGRPADDDHQQAEAGGRDSGRFA